MDDFLVFDNDKGLLQELKNRIRGFLKDRLNLGLHEGKSQIYKTDRGIKFLGFRLFKEHRRLTTDNVRRFKKRMKEFIRHCEPRGGEAILKRDCFVAIAPRNDEAERVRASVRCWVAHAKYANTVGLRRNIVNRLAICDKRYAISDMVRGEMLC